MLPQSREALIELALSIEALQDRKKYNLLEQYAPYPKQAVFHAAGALFRERMLSAGNQLGKTYAAAAEVAMHLTGRYPDWWDGIRFNRPVRWIVGSESGELTRNGAQRLLIGPPEQEENWGSGYVPRDAIKGHHRRQGVANALDSVSVAHISGGTSTLLFKSYDQGRTKWQADTADGVWLDEEPPDDVYSEAMTRTNTTQGPVMLTFTPLKGMSTIVARFLKPPADDNGAKARTVVKMTIHEALHYTPEQRETIINSYPPHEREARAMGEPMLGSGRVFAIDESRIKYEAEKYHPFPNWFAHIAGIDFGWDHPTAVAWLAWDRETDIAYLYDVYRQAEATPIVHAAVIRKRGDWIPVAWPHDGLQHDKGSGIQLAQQYRDLGTPMLDERATFEDGSNGLEAGVHEMLIRFETGRLRVASHLTEFWEEFRMYHRKDGKLIKERDDILAAVRYALMMLRFARPNTRQHDSFEPGAETVHYAGHDESFEPG